MKRIFTKIWLVSFMVLTSISAFAYDFEVDGIYYNITSQSKLEVGVTYKELSFYGYNTSYEGLIRIPSTVNNGNKTYTVTSIEKSAFGALDGYYKGCEVTHIYLPTTIKTIQFGAFGGCNYLKEIKGLENVEIIGERSFYNTNIKYMDLPSIKEIGYICFDTSSIETLILGPNLEKIYESAFYRCDNLKEIFFTSLNAPVIERLNFDYSPYLERYVPSSKVYGFGKDYISFDNESFEYSGGTHNVNWTNNIKYLNCNIPTIQTEVNVGDYTKYVTATYSGDINLTVEIPYQYEITPASLTVTVNDQEREYGMTNPTFTSNVSGFVPGESLTSLGISPSYQCDATQTSNVGNYQIRATLEASNYDVTYNYGNLTITKAPLSISVINSERQYGDSNPVFELNYSGLRNDEAIPTWNSKPQFQTNATNTSSVGDYEVTVSGGEAINYNITQYIPGTLTILKRDLIAKAKDEVRLFGEENPEFIISYSGFANGENSSVFNESPIADCSANSDSNVGNYPIVVSGGLAENYNFLYENGTLTIEPLTIGWENEYSSVTYNDMTVSTSDLYFNYIPNIKGDFSEDDFWIELWFLDKDNKYGEQQNNINISGGEYSGTYIYTNIDRPMWVGKYIFELKSKGTNPNVVANPVRTYLTVNTASTNLEWNASSIIEVEEGQTIDLGISYEADMWCSFNTDFDSELISVTYENAQSNTPTWYVTGLKQGETTLYFSIQCLKNDQGFYDFKDSSTLSRKIRVIRSSGNNGNTGIDVEKIILNIESLELNIGETKQLEATVIPEDATDKTLIWNSSNKGVASVSEDGLVSAISTGETIITVTCGEVSAICQVTVLKPIINPEQILLNLEFAELNIGETVQLDATVLPDDTTDKTVTWSSSNGNVASVDSEGLVSAISEGYATITATCGEVIAECELAVLEDAGVESLLANPDSKISIYSIDGILIKKDCSVEEVKNLSKGFYFLKSGNKSYKIAL